MDALAHSWPQGLRTPRGVVLAHSDLLPRTDAPRDSPSLATSSKEGSTDSETGHLMASTYRPLETSCLVPGRDAEVLGDLPQEKVHHHFGESAIYKTDLSPDLSSIENIWRIIKQKISQR